MATAVPNPNPRKGQVPLDVERFFQVSLYLLLVTAFVTLVSTGKLDMVSLLLVAVALLFRGYLVSKDREIKIPERWTSYLTVLYIGLYIADYTLISNNNFVVASIHLVLFIIVVKMFSIHRDRDYIYLTVLAFLSVLAAAVLTVDAMFLASFAMFLAVAVSTFISMEMRRSSKSAANLDVAGLEHSGLRRLRHFRNVRHLRAGLHVSLAAATFAIVGAILVCALVIFFMLPRLSGGYLSRLAQQNTLTTGFSDNISLGEIGRLQQSDEIVLHVKIEGETPGATEFKLRGVSLNNFTGQRWSATPANRLVVRQPSGRFDLRSDSPIEDQEWRFARGAHGRVLQYKVAPEPMATDIVFALPNTSTLFGRFRMISVDAGGSIRNLDHERTSGVYSAIAETGSLSDAELRRSNGPFPASITEKYLQVPTLDPRIPELAKRLTADAPSEYDKAIAIERYLTSSFGYTLELPPVTPADPLANFLFERKRGHCEYFSTSMAIMLRSLGIPTRTVTGFRGGEFNGLTGEYIIRARNAHAWVEIFFPNKGWVTFDPTPAASLPPESAWNRVQLYMDAMREFWREWVVNYDFSHQQLLGTAAVKTSRKYVDDVRDWMKARYERVLDSMRRASKSAAAAPGRTTGYILLTITGLGMLISSPQIVASINRARIARAPGRRPQGAAAIWYDRLLKALARRGWRKRPTQTPAEYLETIADERLRRSVERFTTHYERARFGNSARDAEHLPELYEEITSNK